VPFAFAGDQFQTLNPTGFRWDAIKASFVEKFIHALDPRGRSGRTELNYRELRYNYRSTPAIVRFSNGIQALRSALFDMPELRPQAAWAISQYAFPVTWFDSGDAAFWKKFREVGSFIVVVPCNEGEEADFVAKDAVLRENIRMEDGIPQNLLSAARAKGREYPVVVIYGFGDSCPDDLMDSLESSTGDSELSLDHALPHQYFINRLYVAASRPKQRLIVVDSKDGINKLWNFALYEEFSKKVLDVANRGRTTWSVDSEDAKSPVVEIMTMGKSEDLTRESAADPIENAKAFEQDGKARKDAFLLRQAALAYRSANNSEKAAECRARALELEGNFIEAAQNFAEAGFLCPQAVRCYWKAGKAGWSPLVDLGTTNPTVAQKTEFRWALKLQSQLSSIDEVLELLEEVVNRMPESEFGDFVLREPSWHDAIGFVASKAVQNANPGQARMLANLLAALESAGVTIPPATIARINYNAGDLQKAIDYWEKAGNTTSDDYARAKAATAPYPEKLAALARTASARDIVTEFEKQSDIPLDTIQWGIVEEAYLNCSQFDQAIEATWKSGHASVARKAALSAIARGEESPALLALKSAVVLMVRNNEWETLSKFASTLDFAPDAAWTESGPREIVERISHELQCLLVRALARSDAFTEMPGHLQRQFSDFLRRFLRVKEGQWRAYLSVEEAGSAIERGGRFTDAIAFYEAIQKEANFSDSEKAFAQKRWLVCKNRQIDYERQQGAKSRRLSELERELAENQRLCGVARLSDFPLYPVLEKLDKNSLARPVHVPTESSATEQPEEVTSCESAEFTNAEPSVGSNLNWNSQQLVDSIIPQSLQPDDGKVTLQLTERVSAQLGDIRIELSRTLGRCNFSNVSTMKTAHMNLNLASIGGELEWQASSENSWFCEEWNLFVQHSGSKLVVNNRSLGISITLETQYSPSNDVEHHI
jgi:tetratricopeptide (TPR) repeat protein